MATNTEKIVVQVVVKGQGDLEKLNQNTKKTTKGFAGLSKGVAAAATGILAAYAAFRKITQIVSSAIRTFKDFEFEMAKVKAITGATEGEFKKLTFSARELGKTTFFTATQVAQLQVNYGKLGFTTQEILDAQAATIDLATATQTDLARAAIVAGAAVRGFGLDATETQRVVDVMAVAFTSSAMDIEKFQTSMTKVAPIAKSAGFSLEDTTAIMSKLTDAGIEASIAGTSLRNILLKMQDPNSDLVKSFGKTIHSFDELLPAMKSFIEEGGSLAEIMEVVDLRQAAAFEQMLTSADSTRELRDALNEATGAAEKMSDVIKDTLEGDLKELTSAWQGFQESVLSGSPKLVKSLRNIADVTTELLNKLSDYFKSNENLAQDLVNQQLDIVNTQLEDQIELFKTLSEEDKKIYGRKQSDMIRERISHIDDEISKNQKIRDHKFMMGKNLDEEIKQNNILTLAKKELNILLKEQEELEKEVVSEKKIKKLQQERVTLGTLREKLKELKEERELISITNTKALDNNKKQIDSTQQLIDKIEGETKAVKKNKKAKEDSALATDFLSTVSTDYLNTLLQDVLSGTSTMENAQQELRNFQIDLINNLLKDEQLSYKERVKLEEQLVNLKLGNAKAVKDANQEQIDGVAALGQQLITLAGEDEKMQKIRKVGVQISAAAAVANNLLALSNAAVGVTEQSKLTFPANIIAMLTTLSTVVSLIANIRALKNSFGNGGVVEEFAHGGMVHGRSHAQGGEKFAVGGRVVELEGGEAVINKRSTSMFRNQLSAMNAAGGGVKFADGGLMNMPTFAQSQFNATNQAGMMGAIGQGNRVVVVESDISDVQNTVSVIESEATF
jgi:TP901 family phage tail tape measure protein